MFQVRQTSNNQSGPLALLGWVLIGLLALSGCAGISASVVSVAIEGSGPPDTLRKTRTSLTVHERNGVSVRLQAGPELKDSQGLQVVGVPITKKFDHQLVGDGELRIAVGLKSSKPGTNLEVRGTVTYPDGREIRPTAITAFDGFCSLSARPVWPNSVRAVTKPVVPLEVIDEVCIKFSYGLPGDPRTPFTLRLGNTKFADDGSESLTFHFSPAILEVFSY